MPQPVLDTLDADARERIEAAQSDLDTALTARTPAISLGEAFGNAGRHYLAYGFHQAAAVCFDNASGLDRTSAAWPYLAAVAHQDGGRLEAAEAALDTALARDPDLLEALLRRGRVRLDFGRADAAVGDFAAVIERSSGVAPAHYGLGLAAMDSGDPTAAIGHFERALSLDAEATSIHHSLALAYQRVGDEARAQAHRARSGRRPPAMDDPLVEALGSLLTGANVHLAQGMRARQTGLRERALAHFRRAVELDPTLARGWHNLGAMLAEDSKLDLALPMLERAVALDPDTADARFDLATALAAAGRLEAAIATFDAVLVRAPDDAEAERRRDLVRAALARQKAKG